MNANEAKASKFSILGKYSGECADSNITNKNGMDITRPVWEAVFSSDDYKQAIDMGWYIGYLGHPEDPGCMDFEHGCIVMTEGHIDDNGKVYGEFNLIDTPVGRVVKAFQDAGVTFGISVRGAGDVIGNSVDPDTFVFRGFDLVTFPAFPESIPTFTQIAASTDLEQRKKYEAVCAAVKTNLKDITDCESLDQIQSQFAKQSDEYRCIEDRKRELKEGGAEDLDELESITGEKLRCMTDMYLDASARCRQLESDNAELHRQLEEEKVTASRKLNSVRRIFANQITALEQESQDLTGSKATLIAANSKLKSELERTREENLKYNQKIRITASTLADNEAQISELRSKLNETVNAASDEKRRTSNLDAKVRELNARVVAAERLLSEYQAAYANLYSNAIGADSSSIEISASTSVKDLQRILGCASDYAQPMSHEELNCDIDVADDDGSGLITM